MNDILDSEPNLFAVDERLHVLADSVSDIVWATDANGVFNFANARWNDYTHEPPPSNADQEAGLAFLHPEDRTRTMTRFRRSLESGNRFECEYRLKRWDGVYRWFLSRGVAHRNREGQIVRWVGTCTDIDDLKQALTALRESEGRFRDIAENISEVFWLANAKNDVIYVSPAYENIWGMSCESCYSPDRNFLTAVHKEDKQRVVAALAEKNTGRFDVEYRIVRPDGEIRWIHDRAFPVLDDKGEVIRVAGIAEDITARRLLEQDVRFQGYLLASVRQAIISTDAGGRIVSWNRHAETMYGWTAEEAIGQDIAELMFPEGKSDDDTAPIRPFDRIDRERQIRRKDGTLIWVSVSAAPILDLNGNVTHTVGSSVDITERRHLEQQYRQSQKMEAVGRLAGGVAHDFNNLLTVIKGHAEFLSRSLPTDGESREDIDQISKAAQRASVLTRQLLAFSRQQVMEKHVIHPNSLLLELEKMLTRLVGDDIDIVVELHPRAPSVLADSGQLEQALMNLVVNARDAMPNGGHLQINTSPMMLKAVDVARHLDSRPGLYVSIAVTDSGTGIDPDVLAKIFDPFFTTKNAVRGTGLGLATVYGIAQQLGGFVDVVSEVGKGSTFTLYLPAAPADGMRNSVPIRTKSIAGDELIMLVEDQDEVRTVARRILLSHGYRVIEARNGVDALAILANLESGVNLVLTDAVMPQMGGPELIRVLRSTQPDIPAVMVSGYTDRELDTYGARELNVPFLSKPFRGEDLLRIVRETLEKARA
jgi:two-component system, cell cycle sensor histidine kinase and response regulator CckA